MSPDPQIPLWLTRVLIALMSALFVAFGVTLIWAIVKVVAWITR